MYTRLCEGVNDYGKLIPKSEDIYKYVRDQKKDYYVSVYDYNEKQKKQFEEKGSISGITEVVTNKLVFDFDSNNIEESRKDALSVIERLDKLGIKNTNINIYFSGGKGFHVVLSTNHEFTPKQAKNAALSIAKGLDTFDSVVYNSNRIFRLPYTKHPESGLYKIPLSFEELKNNSIEEIKIIASEEYAPEDEVEVKLNSNLIQKIFKENEQEDADSAMESTLLNDLDLTKRPKNLSPWKYAIEQGFFPPKQRSNALLILAATYKSLGYSKTKCYYALKAAADLQSNRFNQPKFDKQEIYRNIIHQVYSNTWEGGTFAEDNFPEQLKKYLVDLGVPRIKEDDIHENFVVDITRGFDSFGSYAEKIDENTMTFGIPDIDDILRVQVGHLIGILGSPGCGKTSMALTLLNNTSKQGIKSFFASYDMAGNILIQKLIQRQTGLQTDELYDAYRNNDIEKKESFKKILHKNFSNVSFCFKVGQTVDELRDSIKQEEVRLGEEIKLVIVDYLELVRTRSSDPTQASAEAIQGLREIANEGKVVICLLQPNKLSSTVSEPILTYNAAKGSAAIAQAVTSMITCYREGYDANNPEMDKFFNINIVKNRLGPLGKADFSWEGLTGKIASLEDIQKQELAELRQLKKAEKSENEI
jgi:KaiC/GvpD/RAD55 family RecA-like ATPase